MAEHPYTSVPLRFVDRVERAHKDIGEWMRSPVGRAVREDWLLADLLQHPEQSPYLARILPVEAFTTPQRQEVYRILLNLGESGDPIDEVIVAWELEKQRALEQIYSGGKKDFRGEPELG